MWDILRETVNQLPDTSINGMPNLARSYMAQKNTINHLKATMHTYNRTIGGLWCQVVVVQMGGFYCNSY